MEEADALGENQLEALPMEEPRYFYLLVFVFVSLMFAVGVAAVKIKRQTKKIRLNCSTAQERERERARRNRRETATASITSCNNNFAPINQRDDAPRLPSLPTRDPTTLLAPLFFRPALCCDKLPLLLLLQYPLLMRINVWE